MRYLVDGYNVTKRDPATSGLSIAEQRDALERRLRATAARVLGSSSYTIVWDAAGGEGVVRPAGDKVAYTRLPTADDAIVERVRRAPERIGVVTSDRELAERCRAVALHGIDVLPSERLFAGASAPAKSKGGRGKRKPMPRDVGIPANANEINRELKKLWGIED
ncbi:NYN domain-containing protein [Eggerthella sp. NSJ-70]|uniref:NYN domain-containing protein n=1 Tax=Eggerthella hominis TaxID=2763043 RepID=A0ABR7BRH5_9ACTN|nr:NYN domain-containing protein [Eggerthella hominis]